MKEILLEPKDEEKNEIIDNSIKNKSIFNHFFFFKSLKLLKKAKQGKIKFDDVKEINQNKDINSIINEKSDNNYLIKKGNILNFLIEQNKTKISFIIFLNILRIILMILNPFLFKQFSKPNINIFHLILCVLIIDFLRTSLSLRIELKSNDLILSIDNKMKQIIIKNDLLNFNLNENNTSNEKISSCNTIFNNDIETIKQFFYLFPNFFSVPLLFISYYLVLYFMFGFSSLISFLLLIVIIFINIYLQGKLKQGQKNKQSAIDERMKFMTNLIYNLKNIKILLYEKFFYNKIISKRNSELNKYEILYQTANKIRSLLWASPTLLILLTIICHILFCLYNNIKIKVENLLIIFGLIDSFQQPILTFCQTYSSYIISKVCEERIEKYLVPKNIRNNIDKNQQINLNDIKFDKNDIIFIIGDTGSGKSFLIKQIYNDYKNSKNNNNLYLIYNGQDSFILNDTIQSNIFFMKEKNTINNNIYLEILKNSCLEYDLSLMEKGDLTQAGEAGNQLSGGQKKRICISRALLEAKNNKLKEQILFFDEPTYSLDPETLINVWNKCFIDYLKNTTRIIATNNLDLLKYGNKIIYVENREIIFCGNYSEFKENKAIYEKYIKLDNLFKQRNKEIKDELNSKNKNNNNNFISSKANISPVNNAMNNNKTNKFKIYDEFITILLGGYKNFFILIFILIIWIVLRFLSEYFLFIFKNNNSANASITNLITFYIIINIVACFLLYIRLVLTSSYTISGGRNLHEKMINPIINASIKDFQNKYNSNQLINNFSRDLGMVDFFSSVMFGNCLTFGGAFIALLIVIIKFFNIFIIFIPIFIFIGFFLTNLYLDGFRQLIQLENQMRTQIINFIKEMNLGREEIYSYNISDKFIIRFKELYKKYYLSHLTFKNANAWFLYSISRISFILKLIFMFYFYYQSQKSNIFIFQDKIGILFISIFSIHEYFNRFLSHVVTFQNSLMAFNRCISCTNLSKENTTINIASRNKNNDIIFSKGLQEELIFDNVCIKYNKTGENVLKNISLRIKKGEKIGIIGKTGVGKTTLLMSLIKLVDVNEGKIIFDENIDINDIDINILRQNIICITQDINLFDELTIKENIDPYEKYNKNEIKNIIENYSFSEFINSDKKINLDKIFDIKLKDLNLSFGQKNIICLIRAILRYHENKNSIILIDEMTDKNDLITSDKIMDLLINKFKEGTILIVTHRMNSIKNCDKILVLEEGKIAEFDNPKKLLSNPNSIFYNIL